MLFFLRRHCSTLVRASTATTTTTTGSSRTRSSSAFSSSWGGVCSTNSKTSTGSTIFKRRRMTTFTSSINDNDNNNNSNNHVQSNTTQKKKKKVAVIGAGAAGLTMVRILQRFNNKHSKKKEDEIDITVFESTQKQGGIWRYETNNSEGMTKSRPMYAGLRTNLPKEIMAYREYPWYDTLKGCETTESFVTHTQVQQYLQSYSRHFSLDKYIKYGCQINELKLHLPTKSSSSPQVLLKWNQNYNNNEEQTKENHSDIFDAVCICNGHYSKPSIPKIDGLIQNFHGQILHSIEYDDPSVYTDRTVLCVGGRASGADITKEISHYAQKVYISDSTCPTFTNEEGPPSLDNIVWIPKTKYVEPNGSIVFEDSTKNTSYTASDIDTIIFCTGYDYDFPFLKSMDSNNVNDNDNDSHKTLFDQLFSTSMSEKHSKNSEDDNDAVEMDVPICFTAGERRVMPLLNQIFHAIYPHSIAFVGLPHSVVPFSLMELQAEAIVEQWFGDGRTTTSKDDNDTCVSSSLPEGLKERLELAKQDATSGGPRPDRNRVQDTHYLGNYQWNYLRQISKQLAHNYSDKMEQFISKQEAIYNDTSAERKNLFPGGPDTYRQTRYTILKDKPPYFTKVSSLLQPTTTTSRGNKQFVMTDQT